MGGAHWGHPRFHWAAPRLNSFPLVASRKFPKGCFVLIQGCLAGALEGERRQGHSLTLELCTFLEGRGFLTGSSKISQAGRIRLQRTWMSIKPLPFLTWLSALLLAVFFSGVVRTQEAALFLLITFPKEFFGNRNSNDG